jgi:hypothetical protein
MRFGKWLSIHDCGPFKLAQQLGAQPVQFLNVFFFVLLLGFGDLHVHVGQRICAHALERERLLRSLPLLLVRRPLVNDLMLIEKPEQLLPAETNCATWQLREWNCFTRDPLIERSFGNAQELGRGDFVEHDCVRAGRFGHRVSALADRLG